MPPEFKYEVKMSCMSSIQYQIIEAILVQSEKCNIFVNGKEEWGIIIIPQFAQVKSKNSPESECPNLKTYFQTQYT